MASYRCFAWKRNQKTPSISIFQNPLDALTCAVDYLKAGYQVRLGNECIDALKEMQVPRRKGNWQCRMKIQNAPTAEKREISATTPE